MTQTESLDQLDSLLVQTPDQVLTTPRRRATCGPHVDHSFSVASPPHHPAILPLGEATPPCHLPLPSLAGPGAGRLTQGL